MFIMWWLLVCLICTQFTLPVNSKEEVSVRGKVKIVMESVDLNCDHDFVEYFRQTPDKARLYTFRVVRTAPSFSITIVMRSLKSKRIMYKLNNLDGCQFISNPIMNKVLAHSYNAIIVNNSFTGCPIPPKVYYLRNMATPNLIPTFHPAGHYQTNVRIRMSLSKEPFVMEVTWKYNVVHLK